MSAELEDDVEPGLHAERANGHGAQRASAPSGGAVYGLGMIGALVWFWQQADGTGERAVAVLKAIVWPAFLVYEAFKAFKR
ncbi:MAG TPA: hypothetical protein VK461_14195 [Acidimicrobiales bacterium]|nr:hypothetical protein [Acidimicrobiales bacterium]